MQLSVTECVHAAVHPPGWCPELCHHPAQKLRARETLTAHRLLPQPLAPSALPTRRLPGLDSPWTWDCTMFVFLGLISSWSMFFTCCFPWCTVPPQPGAPQFALKVSSLRRAALVNVALVSAAVTVLTAEGGAVWAVTWGLGLPTVPSAPGRMHGPFTWVSACIASGSSWFQPWNLTVFTREPVPLRELAIFIFTGLLLFQIRAPSQPSSLRAFALSTSYPSRSWAARRSNNTHKCRHPLLHFAHIISYNQKVQGPS